MTDRTIVATPHAPGAIGPYSQAIVAGGFVHCSGQIGLDPTTGDLVPGGVREQAVRVMENLKGVLEAAGSDFSRAVKCNVYLTTMSDFAAVNEIYGRYFEAGNAPARATVAVAMLPRNALVEVDCLALA
ncbi:MAG TPA: RidA family protein [Planctomycetota bacterium]|nr:RidA family protein [Planctomycetota bacterium]